MSSFTPKPALEKLPLAVKKNVRDNFESKRDDFEERIKGMLDVPEFKLDYDLLTIWPYTGKGSDSPGHMLNDYTEGFIEALRYYLAKHGDAGKSSFTAAVSESALRLAVNPKGDGAEMVDAEIKDGVFYILFKHSGLGYNTSSLKEFITKAVDTVPRAGGGLSVVAQSSVDKGFTARIDELEREVGEVLGMEGVRLEGNFDANYAVLVAGREKKSWEESFGHDAFDYFKGLRDQLVKQGFRGDEMLQEGLGEVLEGKKFVLRIVPEVRKECGEVVLEDGVAYIQTTEKYWGYNVQDAGKGLVDLL